MWKRLLAVLAVLLLAVGGWFGWDRWQQHQVSELADAALADRKDERALRERISRAESRDDAASGAAAWVQLSLARPNDPVPPLRASLAWEAAGQPTNAYSVLNQAYKKWPKNVRVLQTRAAFFERQLDRPQAVKTFHEWIQIQPKSVDAHLRLADVLYAAGVLEDAAAHYRAALAVDPKPDRPLRRQALISHLRGDNESALTSTNALLARGNNEGITRQLKAEIELSIHGSEGAAAAEDELNFAVVNSPELGSSAYLLGLMKEMRGDLKSAATQYRRLLARDPFHRGGTFRMARLLGRMGSSSEAEALQKRHRQLASAQGEVERLTSALSASPGDPALTLPLARAFRTLGRLQDAMNAYSQVLRARPSDNALQREVQPLLRQLTPPQGAAGATQP